MIHNRGFEFLLMDPDVTLGYRYAAVLQAVLSARGYYTGELDGVFGDVLDAAVRKFQMDNDLVVDGVCGPQTWREILKLS